MQFGIWEFDANFGLIGRPGNFSEYYISIEKIWETQVTPAGEVWKWPVYFASQSWFTPGIAKDLNKAFAFAQNFFEGQRPAHLAEAFDFDSRTTRTQTELLEKISTVAAAPVERI